MSVITNKWNDESGDSITIESPSFQGNQTVKISSPVQKSTSKRSMKFIGKCKKDSSKQVILTVEQEASTYTYNLTLNSDNTEIAAKGGTATITAVLKTYRNGNLVSTDNVTPILSGSATGFSISDATITASNRTTTVGSRRSIVVTGKYSNTFDGQTVSSTITIYQEANEASYGALTGGSVLASDIPANGGTSSTSVTNMSQTISYTSGSTRAGTVTYSKTDEITVSSLGTAVKVRTKVGQVTVTYTGEGGATANKIVDIYQSENVVIDERHNLRTIEYGIPTIEIGEGLTAAGGTAIVTYSVNNTAAYNTLYSSGATGADQTYSTPGGTSIVMTVNGNSRFTLEGDIITHVSMGTDVTTDVVTITATNVDDLTKTAEVSKSIDNAIIDTTYGDITITNYVYDVVPASGATVSPNLAYSQVPTQHFTSGSTNDLAAITSDATLKYSKDEGELLTVDPITGAVNGPNRGTEVGEARLIGIARVTITLNGIIATNTVAITQQVNELSVSGTTGGDITYGDVVAGEITNATIPANGGTAIATAGIGTQTWNKSAVTTNYSYTSGAVSSTETEAASSGSSEVSPDVASIEATAPSLGTTVKDKAIIKSQEITWSANGKSASGTMYIYQEANSIDSYNYSSWNIAISANPTTIAASGGTSTITASCTRTKTPVYTSGSTGIATTESATPTLAISGTGFTLSETTVTASKNNVAARTATVTASYSEATSKSVIITQSAGPDGIGYMQIQGNGVDHYIFQVGRTPNTRSNDIQTLSEEPAEVATETKSESLLAKIKRIITNLN